MDNIYVDPEMIRFNEQMAEAFIVPPVKKIVLEQWYIGGDND